MSKGSLNSVDASFLVEYCEDRKPGFAQQLVDPNVSSLSFAAYHQVFDQAAKWLNERDLALQIAALVRPSDFGIIGYLSINSPDLKRYCDMISRFSRVLQPGASFTVTLEGRTAQFRYELDDKLKREMRHDIDLTLAIMIKFFREQIGARWQPDSISVQYSAVPDSDLRRASLGRTINYRANYNGFVFDANLLERKIDKADPQLQAVLLDQAESLLSALQDEDDLVAKLRLMIATAEQPVNLGADQAAQRFNITRRTLHRYLSEYGLSYQNLKNRVICEIAQKALRETDSPITEIGIRLGYSENSAFTRAFKSETGKTPKQYRLQA